MKLKLPFPISVNKLYRSGRNNRRYKTQEAVSWQEEVLWLIKSQSRNQSKPVGNTIYVSFYKPFTRKWDSNNYIKILYDTLELAGIIKNDADITYEQIQKIQSEKEYCEVEIL